MSLPKQRQAIFGNEKQIKHLPQAGTWTNLQVRGCEDFTQSVPFYKSLEQVT